MKKLARLSWMMGTLCGIGLLLPQTGWSQQERPQDQPDRPAASAEAEEEAGSTHSGEFGTAGDGQFSMTADGKKHSHQLAENAKITLNGEQAQLKDLREGDRIQVTTNENNEAVAIRATRGTRPQGDRPDSATREERPRSSARTDRERAPGEEAAAPGERRGQAREGREQPGQAAQTPKLGVRIAPSRTTGVLIRTVREDSPASQAGIRSGDYILSINGTKITSVEDFDQAMQGLSHEEAAELVLWRNNRKMTNQVQFDEQFTAGFRPDQGNAAGGDQAWLGVMLGEARQQGQGALIERVHPDGPAARAGLQNGDVLIRVGNQEVTSSDQAAELIGNGRPNQELQMTVLRDGEETRLTAVLADRRQFLNQQGERGQGFQNGQRGERNRGFRGGQDPRLESTLNEMRREIDALRREVEQLKARHAGEEQPSDRGAAPTDRNRSADRDAAPADRGARRPADIPRAPSDSPEPRDR